jgi:hypothetical protein
MPLGLSDNELGNTGSTLTPKYGWGQAGKLTTGRTDRMVTMQATFPDSYTYTAEFSKDDNPLSNNPIFAEALITWATEGHFVSRRINVANGCSISGVAQSVKVIITDATGNLRGAPNNVEYGVAVQVSRGVRGANKQPPVLVPGVAKGIGGTHVGGSGFYPVFGSGVDVPVPQNAGIISVFVTVGASPMVGPVTQPQDTFRVVHSYLATALKIYDPRNFPDWVPIAPGVDTIELQNFSGAEYDFSVIFGVDG